MENGDLRVRGPGPRPWIIGIVLLALVAALAFWLLDDGADDKTLDSISRRGAAAATVS
ncbi:hypothetical protein [Longimicrobium sp.]|jgi:hypothetical protein|uniref:hypothetical protein n=1 Tax=Longimicrobium sp. TaxID=2029185 RepID=UPI002F9485B2